MDEKFVQEKAEIAKRLVQGIDERFKDAAFSAVLAKLLDGEKKTEYGEKQVEIKGRTEDSKDASAVVADQKGKESFLKKCDISMEELDRTLYIRDDYVQLLKTIKGGEAEKQRLACKCILTVFLEMRGKDWVDSDTLNMSLQKSGVSLVSLARNLRNDSESFSIRGRGKGSTLEYAITGPAKFTAYETIKKLAKGESLD